MFDSVKTLYPLYPDQSKFIRMTLIQFRADRGLVGAVAVLVQRLLRTLGDYEDRRRQTEARNGTVIFGTRNFSKCDLVKSHKCFFLNL